MSRPALVGYGPRHTGIVLREIYEAFTAEIFERLAGHGFDDLRPAHAHVFQHLKEEGVRLTTLAEQADITPQSMGALVDDLERLGYVSRQPDSSDRRASLIRPTERGHAEVIAARQVISEIEQECEQVIGKGRLAAVVGDLNALNHHLRRHSSL